jgi:hypothetical protein
MKKLFLLFLITNMMLATLTGQVMMMFSTDPASGITSPLDLDSLFYWYAADVGVTATNNKVTQWNDLSGNGHHVTQADTSKAPTYEATGGPGSRPTMTFDGTDDFMASAAHWWGSDDLTVIVVMKFANATRNAVESIIARLAVSASNRQFDIAGRAAGLDYDFFFRAFSDGTSANSVNFDGPNNFKSTSFEVHSFGKNATTTATLFSNGSSRALNVATAGTGDGTIWDASQILEIGSVLSGTANFLQGSISEIIVYSRALTTAERENLEKNYLCKKYGLACP